MEIVEKEVSYLNKNSYSTLNKLTKSTKSIWIVCHGLGYLSRYFIRHFSELDPLDNYIIAPQASAKYYLGNDFKRVGASWLTRENTMVEVENVLNYFDSVLHAEHIVNHDKLIILGYSQGVSVAMRWMARRKIVPKKLILFSGRIPKELTKKDFVFLDSRQLQITHVAGKDDPYLTKTLIDEEAAKLVGLFSQPIQRSMFEGGHELDKEELFKISIS